jgi:hypothetical protein
MTRLLEIQKMAEKDLETRPDDIEFISIQTPMLQSRYLRLLNEESLLLSKLEFDYDVLYKDKWDYYRNNFNIALTKKDDLLTFINGDEDIIKLKAKISLSKRTMTYIEDIIRTLRERSFHVKNLIEYRKFISGT